MEDVPALSLYCDFTGAAGCIRRGTQPEHRRELLKSYAAVCLEGVVIALCCVIYSAYAAARPDVSADSSAAIQVLTYIGELTFNMLVLVGLMKGANQVTREMLGL